MVNLSHFYYLFEKKKYYIILNKKAFRLVQFLVEIHNKATLYGPDYRHRRSAYTNTNLNGILI